MPAKISVAVKNEEVLKLLKKLGKLNKDLREPLRIAGTQIMGWVGRHFNDEKGPSGKWAPLKELTVRRRRKGKGKERVKVLQNTGRLKQSISGGDSHIYRLKKMSLEIGTNIKYAGVHQFGHTFKRKGKKGKQYSVKIPARPYLWVDDKNINMLNRIFRDWAKKKLEGA